MKTCFVPSRKNFVLCRAGVDDDVRCSEGTATMLTSDVPHGHARRQRRRFHRYIISLASFLARTLYGGVRVQCMHTAHERLPHARLMAVLLLRTMPSWTELRRVHA